MKYTTKPWEVTGFIYDPYDIKPEWFQKMLDTGQAFEYKKADPAYVEFWDKRDNHKAYTGDFIHYDQFNRRDVWSAKNLAQRIKKGGTK